MLLTLLLAHDLATAAYIHVAVTTVRQLMSLDKSQALKYHDLGVVLGRSHICVG